ncbi:MAG: hypothetical protein LBB27_00065 [Tannerellaceae bacterium]|jgi:hypothetical protein|nr:hypothetical protein [Tannerellaceae bacterium]
MEWQGGNPFRVPEGYFEGLSARIMDGLPERHPVVTPSVTRWQRALPWLYLAAVFTGLIVCFRTLLPVPAPETLYSEEDDYEEYLQQECVRYAMAEEIAFLE